MPDQFELPELEAAGASRLLGRGLTRPAEFLALAQPVSELQRDGWTAQLIHCATFSLRCAFPGGGLYTNTLGFRAAPGWVLRVLRVSAFTHDALNVDAEFAVLRVMTRSELRLVCAPISPQGAPHQKIVPFGDMAAWATGIVTNAVYDRDGPVDVIAEGTGRLVYDQPFYLVGQAASSPDMFAGVEYVARRTAGAADDDEMVLVCQYQAAPVGCYPPL